MLRLLGFGAFGLASLVVGLRLLLLARRTRQLPELAMAISFLCAGVLGYGLAQAATNLALLPEGSAAVAYALGRAFGVVGASALLVFTARVFHPGEGWARAGTALVIAVMGADLVGRGAVHGYGTPVTEGPFYWLGVATRIVVYGWASAESLRYWRLMRRRLRLGLAEPLVTRRFLLWGIGAGAAAGMVVVLTVARSLTGRPGVAIELSSLLGLVSAAAIAWAFFPPAASRRRAAARSAAQG